MAVDTQTRLSGGGSGEAKNDHWLRTWLVILVCFWRPLSLSLQGAVPNCFFRKINILLQMSLCPPFWLPFSPGQEHSSAAVRHSDIQLLLLRRLRGRSSSSLRCTN